MAVKLNKRIVLLVLLIIWAIIILVSDQKMLSVLPLIMGFTVGTSASFNPSSYQNTTLGIIGINSGYGALCYTNVAGYISTFGISEGIIFFGTAQNIGASMFVPRLERLNDSYGIIMMSSSGNGYCKIFDQVGLTLTLGTLQNVYIGTTVSGQNVTALSETKILVGRSYAVLPNTRYQFKVGTVNLAAKTVSFGTESAYFQESSTATSEFVIQAFNDSYAIANLGGNNVGVISISGTTVTLGTEIATLCQDLCVLNETTAVALAVRLESGSYYIYAKVITRSGTTLTVGPEYLVSPVDSQIFRVGEISVFRKNNNKFWVTFIGGADTQVYAVEGKVTGDSIEILGQATLYPSISSITSTYYQSVGSFLPGTTNAGIIFNAPAPLYGGGYWVQSGDFTPQIRVI